VGPGKLTPLSHCRSYITIWTYPNVTGMSGQRRNRRGPADGEVSAGDSVGSADVLADSRRRHVIAKLREVDSCQLTALAEAVARKEIESGTRAVSQARLRAVYVDLQRNHLPALVEAELVQYAEDVGHVTLRGSDEALSHRLDAAEET
jgi:hypothetical protein